MKKKQTKKQQDTFRRVELFLHDSFASIDPKYKTEIAQTNNDFRNALLVVSVLINAFILTTWLVLQTTSQYNTQIISHLLR